MSAAAPTTSSRRPPRVPGFVNLIGAFVLLVAVMSLALIAQNASPPAIAEFAPQPQHRIEQAPSEQTSSFGNGRGGAAIGSPAPSPKASPTVPPGAIISNCIGDPPRQIEDPQSPPCVPYWVGNNGGSTSMGVNKEYVTVVSTQQQAEATVHLNELKQFFNKRFEFYHRQIFLKDDSGNPNGGDAQGQRAEANLEYQQDRPFAAMNNNSAGGISYADQLAQDHVIATLVRPYLPESYMQARAPYIWSYPMATDTLMQTFAAWACRRLKGTIATHAGAPLTNAPRKFGLVFTTEAIDVPVTPDVFEQSLQACGIHLSYVAPFTTGGNSSQGSSNFETAIVQMKSMNITSVFCLCGRTDLGALGRDEDAQAYYPEWMVTTYILMDDNANIRALVPSANVRARLFGLTMQPMQRQFLDKPSTWADPTLPYNSSVAEEGRDYEYRNLLLIASGIQMAGPLLTPTTFQAGLQRAIFPNPDTAIREGHVGFNGRTHSMTVDAAEMYWGVSESGPLPDEQGSGGAWCYVDHGRRHSLADPWPRGGDPWFKLGPGQCDSGNEPAR